MVKRSLCSGCGRPDVVCYCARVHSVSISPHRIIVLRHYDEIKKPIGTVNLLRRSLEPCIVFDGIDFSDNNDFQSLLAESDRKKFLLYPGDDVLNLSLIRPSEIIPWQDGMDLIVIDGTWRNTRQILMCNPSLNTLPRITMNFPDSKYRIRKSQLESGVSTIEAAVYVFDRLSNGQVDCLKCLDAFDDMIGKQIAKMGPEIFEKNYSGR